MLNLIILANARSGSTSLAKLLNESPDINLALEPFHPSYSKWNPKARDYSTYIKSSETMNSALDELFTTYNAIKVLVYQFPKEIYIPMLERPGTKIIFLTRKNLANAALSSLIAEQTSMWHKSEMDEKAYDNLKPISLKRIENIVNYIGKMNSIYSALLHENREGDFIEEFYEDMYSENLDVNMNKINSICNFLKIETPPLSAIKQYMIPQNSKQNINNIYNKVPNISQIRSRFGSSI